MWSCVWTGPAHPGLKSPGRRQGWPHSQSHTLPQPALRVILQQPLPDPVKYQQLTPSESCQYQQPQYGDKYPAIQKGS